MTEPYFSTEWCLFPFQRPDLYLISLNENDPIPNITGPKSFVVWADYEARLKEIMSLYPKGKTVDGETSNVKIYEVEE